MMSDETPSIGSSVVSDEDIRNVCSIVADTMRTVAGWSSDDDHRRDLYDVAGQLDRADRESLTGWCCPVCEEVICDDPPCPLRGIRGALADNHDVHTQHPWRSG